jgi:ligand-binding SRPBCC domain-containing protein
MTIHRFEMEQWLPRPRSEVFPFFADAANLQAITPPWLDFRILTPGPIEMRPGVLIDYRISLRGLPLKWRTEICVWEPPFRFVDQQLKGPYRQWIHEHTFEEKDGGTLCRDVVDYAVPGGALVNRFFVRRDVEKIFAYRREQLDRRFAAPGPR